MMMTLITDMRPYRGVPLNWYSYLCLYVCFGSTTHRKVAGKTIMHDQGTYGRSEGGGDTGELFDFCECAYDL